MEGNEIRDTLVNRVLAMLTHYDVNLTEIRNKLYLVLNDFKIEPSETALVVYHEGKNEVLIREFLLAKAVAGRTKKTIEMYGTTLQRAFAEIGKDADTVLTQDIQVMFAKIQMRGGSKCYCNNIYRVLRTFYTWAVNNNRLQGNPTLNIDYMKYPKTKETAMTELELEKMRAVLPDNRQRAIFELLLSTGCRASELVNIKTDDIDDDRIQVFGKGEKYRHVFINAKARVALDAYLKERKDESPYLFPASKYGGPALAKGCKRSKIHDWYKNADLVDPTRPFDKESLNDMLKKIAKKAGVEGVHTHRFRRTCATLALRRGMPIEQVCMMLGHEQITTTQIYLDIREEDVREAHKRYVT